jgi:hypothetical protein
MNDVLSRRPMEIKTSRGDTKDETKRCSTLAQRGLFSKILVDDNIITLETNPNLLQKLSSMYPTAVLPDPITIDTRDAAACTIGDVIYAIRKLGRGKSPGLSGWTRELLEPMIAGSSTVPYSDRITDIFNTFLNAERLTAPERALMLRGILIPLGYLSNSQKCRPVTIKDALSKTTWHIALREAIDADKDLIGGGSSYGRKGGAAAINRIIQEALDNGYAVLCLDGSNAFNEICREAGMQYVKKRSYTYKKAIGWINFNYCNTSQNSIYNREIVATF